MPGRNPPPSIFSMESLKASLREGFLLQGWSWMQKEKNLIFTYHNRETFEAKIHVELAENLFATILTINGCRIPLAQAKNMADIRAYCKAIEKQQECSGTAMEAERWAAKCIGVLDDSEVNKHHCPVKRCLHCRVLRKKLKRRANRTTSIAKDRKARSRLKLALARKKWVPVKSKSSEHTDDRRDSKYDTAGSDNDSGGSEDGESESGDGQKEDKSQKKLDADEDRRNPRYTPKRGAFYMHDGRTTEETPESTIESPTNHKRKRKTKKKKVCEDKEDKWNHDRYNDDEQAPKSYEELIATYGYDIRNEEGLLRARKRPRCEPNKYTRKRKDEDANGRMTIQNKIPINVFENAYNEQSSASQQPQKELKCFVKSEPMEVEISPTIPIVAELKLKNEPSQ